MAEQNIAIKVENLTKKYGRRAVLSGISFTIPTGKFYSLIGPNGVGKTTLIKIISSITRPTTGTVYINGLAVDKEGTKTRKDIGILSHNTFLYKDMTAYENLKFYSKIYNVPDADKRIEDVLSLVELTLRKNDQVGTFSRGMEQRVGIARALLHNPSILILDEPYSGLDPHATDVLDKTITVLKNEGKTFLMTTHDMVKALQFADNVIALTADGIVLSKQALEINEDKLASIFKQELKI